MQKADEVIFSDEEKDIIYNYPYIISYPFLRMLEEQQRPDRKINLLKDTLINSLKYIALLLASEYFESNLKSNTINYLFDELLSRTNSGSLNRFMRESIEELNNQEHKFFIQELPEFYLKIELDKKCKKYAISSLVTNAYGKVDDVNVRFTAIGALVNFRNKYIGHGVTLSDQNYTKLYNEYYPIFLDLLSAMSFISEYKMCKYENGKVWSLMSNKVTIIENHHSFIDREKSLWVQNNKKDKLNLVPFFISPNSYTVGTPEEVEVFVYEEYTKSKMIFFSPESVRSETSGGVLQKLKSLLLNKEENKFYTIDAITTDIISKQTIEFNFRLFENLIREQKIISEVNKNKILYKRLYLNRKEIELHLRSWTGSKFGLFFITAKAGSGKTNLMVEMQKQYADMGFSSLFLRANRIESSHIEMVLKTALDLHPEFDLFEFNKKLKYNQEKPFIILIDGVNEHRSAEEFLTNILEFLDKYSGGFFKVVLNWRADLKEELPKIDKKYNSLFYSDNININGENILADNSHVLNPLNKNELNEAWKLFSQRDGQKYRPRFNLKDLTLFDRKLVDELQNPMHLKLFLELFSNKPLPKVKGFFNLWKNYSSQFKNEEYELLCSLVDILFEYKTDSVPSKILYEHAVFKMYVSNNDIKSPYEQLKLKGVIVEYFQNDDRYLTFVIEAFYHYMLGEYLYEAFKSRPDSDLLDLLENSNLPGIQNGVQYLLIKDVNNKKLDRLNWLVENSIKGMLHYYAYPLTHLFKIQETNNVFNNLDLLNSDKYISVLISSLWIMNRSEEYLLVIEIYSYILKKLDTSDLNKINLKISAFNYLANTGAKLEDTFDVNVLLKSININDLSPGNLSKLYNSIGNAYENLNEFDMAIKYHEKCLEVYVNYLSECKDEISNIYNNIGGVFYKKENYKKALFYYKKANELAPRSVKTNSTSYSNLSLVYSGLNDYRNSEKYIIKSIELDLKKFGQASSRLGTSWYILGRIYHLQEKNEEAITLFKRSLAILSKLFPKNHPELGILYIFIGHTYSSLNEWDRAIDNYKKSCDIFKHNKNSQSLIHCYESLGNAYNEIENYIEAIKYWKLCWMNIDTKKGGISYDIFTCHKELDQPQEALYWLEQTAIVRKERLGEEDDRTVNTITELIAYAKELSNQEILNKWA